VGASFAVAVECESLHSLILFPYVTYVTYVSGSSDDSERHGRMLTQAKRERLVLQDRNDWIDPGVITWLNHLVPNAGPRFFFLDAGGQMTIVTRATETEAERLAGLRSSRSLNEKMRCSPKTRAHPRPGPSAVDRDTESGSGTTESSTPRRTMCCLLWS
jgi:hypothetical protein